MAQKSTIPGLWGPSCVVKTAGVKQDLATFRILGLRSKGGGSLVPRFSLRNRRYRMLIRLALWVRLALLGGLDVL